MTEIKTNPIVHLVPSLTDVAFLLPLIFLFGGLNGMRTLLGDGDTGWHLRIGEWILAHRQVPWQDMFSFTKPGEPFFAWEWLWDASFAWMFQRGGMAAVLVASLLVICSASALLYRLVYRRCGNPLVAIALTGLAAGGASVHWLARPHLFTLLFMMVFLTILERVREGRTSSTNTAGLWALPALTILWTNLHGGFLVGILILGAYAGGELLRAAVTRDGDERGSALRAAAKYLATLAGCALGSLVNPYGYHLHAHILRYLGDPYQMKYIGEFQGTNFQSTAALYLEIMLVLGLAAAVWHGRRKQFGEVLMIVGFGHMALVMVRNLPIYMMAAAPLVAAPLVAWLTALTTAPLAGWVRAVVGTFQEIGEELNPLERAWRIHWVPAAALAVLALGIGSPALGVKMSPEYDPGKYPEKALALLNRPEQRIFTHDEWGDYLIYKLSPQGTKVFVDGRSDFYGGKFGEAYVDIMNVKYNWQQTLDRYKVDTILLPPDAALAGALKESRRWRVAYDDGMAIVFRPAAVAEGRMEQVFTGNPGGIGGGREITSVKPVVRGDHLNQIGGVSNQ